MQSLKQASPVLQSVDRVHVVSPAVPDLLSTKPKFSTQRISPSAVFTQKHVPVDPHEPQLAVTPVGEQIGGAVVGGAVVGGAVVGGAVVGGAVVVEKHVRGFGSRQLSVGPHPPQQEQGLAAIALASDEPGMTHFVLALRRRQVSSALWGTSQTLTVPDGQVIAIAREGISAAMAVPAKSFSARRRLSEPSARERASSSKPWPLVGSSLVGSSDTWCLLSV